MSKQVMVNETIPELSVLDYEFGPDHASALASLLVAAIASNNGAYLGAALIAANEQLQVEFEIADHDYNTNEPFDQSARVELRASRKLGRGLNAFRECVELVTDLCAKELIQLDRE